MVESLFSSIYKPLELILISDQAARVGLLFPQQRERQALICLLELFNSLYVSLFVLMYISFVFLSTKYHHRWR